MRKRKLGRQLASAMLAASATLALTLMASDSSAADGPIRLYAAGSLKAALSEVAAAFDASKSGLAKVETVFGASGLLREKIEKGEPAHFFASADMGHPRVLAQSGRAEGPATLFARNRMCAIARSDLPVTGETLLQVMLNPQIRLGISTPKADPSGDYALALFTRAEALEVGSATTLDAKALRLTGGPSSPRAPDGRNLYGWVMAEGMADLFLTYCTNAILARAEVPSLSVIEAPPTLQVGAEYGLVVLKGAPPLAAELAQFILGPSGRAILERHGFGVP